MLIATAKDCLKECTFSYVPYEETGIDTALGEIVIVEATTDGLALVAGPSSKVEMIKLIKKLKKYQPYNIYIDGALFRKSIAATSVSDSIILSTGASYDTNINKVVDETSLLIDQLHLKKVSSDIRNTLIKVNDNSIIDCENQCYEIGSLWKKENKYLIKNQVNKNTRVLYLKGALTDKIIKQLIEIRYSLTDLTIVIKDATHIVANYNYYLKLAKMGVKVRVMEQIDLLFVTYNPTSPYGYEFNNLKFKMLLKEKINVDCINVVKDME